MKESTLLNTYSKVTFYAILILCFGWGISEHFLGILSAGITGSDEFYYWQMYKDWASGHVTLTPYYRPAAYFIYSKFFQIIGPNDFSHKVLNQIFDVASVFLIVGISWRFFSSWKVGVIAAAVFYTAPIITTFSREGILHSSSAFFVLLVVFFLFQSIQLNKYRRAMQFLCGFSLSCAANIHPDLLVLSVPIGLIYIYQYFHEESETLKDGVLGVSLYSLGFLSIFIISFIVFGFSETIECLTSNRKIQQSTNNYPLLQHLFRIGYHYVRYSSSMLNAILFLGGALFTIRKIVQRKFWTINHLILLVLIGWYILCCKFLFGRALIPRLFIPFISLTLLIWIDLLYRKIAHTKWLYLILSGVLGLVVISTRIERSTSWYLPSTEHHSFPKRLHEQIAHKMDGQSHFLIVPFTVYHIHMPLQKEVYLNGKGIYLALSDEASIDEVIRKNNIKYILWGSGGLDHRIFGKNMRPVVNERLMKFYGISPDVYSEDVEKTLLLKTIEKYSPKKLHESQDVVLYELSRKD